MFREPIPEVFYDLRSKNILQIIGNNIVIEGYTFEKTNNTLEFIFGFFIFLPVWLLLGFAIIDTSFGIKFGKEYFNFFKIEDVAHLFMFFWMGLILFFFGKCMNKSTVIDRDKKCIYSVLNILDLIEINLNKINIEDIIEIGNNVAIYKGKRAGLENHPFHPVTYYCHRYLVSFLLKSGEMISIPFECNLESYDNTVDIAKGISELLGKLFFVCRDDCFLKIGARNNSYFFKLEKREPFSYKADAIKVFKKLAIIFCSVIILFILSYIISAATTKQGLTKKVFVKDMKRLFGINLQKR
jgi:hypothetical protein